MWIASRTLTAVMLARSTASTPMAQLNVAQSGIGGIGSRVAATNPLGNPFNGVANLPYSATFKTTVVQKLTDGTTITQVSTTKEARDSEGRTMRQISIERPNSAPAILNTSVVDPVNHTIAHWMSRSKQATIVHLPG
jgi:hypothetical protein